MNIIENLQWRYATKKFDANQKISKENLETLKLAVQLSSSSYGLQPYQLLLISNQKIKEQLVEYSYGQKQLADCSHVFIFCNSTQVDEQTIDAYQELILKTRNLPEEKVTLFTDMMKQSLLPLSKEEISIWSAKQCYIALDSLLVACASKKIDACPMEGFSPKEYNQLFGLPEKNLNACLVATVGYRSNEDYTKDLPKVRKPLDELFVEIQ